MGACARGAQSPPSMAGPADLQPHLEQPDRPVAQRQEEHVIELCIAVLGRALVRAVPVRKLGQMRPCFGQAGGAQGGGGRCGGGVGDALGGEQRGGCGDAGVLACGPDVAIRRVGVAAQGVDSF